MKREADGDELVAIVAAYVLVTRERRRLAAVPPPASRWREAARQEGVDPAGTAVTSPPRRSRWRPAGTP